MRRALFAAAGAVLVLLVPTSAAADTLPSGERMLGNAAIEPAYDDATGTIVYLLTPNRLAPLNPTQPINNVNSHAVAPLYLIVYPPGTPGTFNCMGAPGNCPDHGGVIATVATSVMPSVYGTQPAAVPGHDHLVGMPHTGDFNVPWHVYVELFTTQAAVSHITTLSGLQAAWASGALVELDTGITFACAVVSRGAYLAGKPAV
ncbi:MAG TPA: hypothetical protein VFL29_02395 [Candidatus Dormibacteraeota bacterium]|nr:hypothetical protein [Candidatus Dormibacteraeota bacterium]